MAVSLTGLLAAPDDAAHLASVLAAVGDPVSPTVLTLQVPDLDAAGERLLGAGIGYRSGNDRIHVAVGDTLTVEVTAAQPIDHAVTAEATGSSIAVRFTSAADAGGLRIPRCVYLTSGADLQEQVKNLLRDQPAGLRAQVFAAATEAVTA